ncbi:protein phosphatase CheZ [Breoghania sp.]|uniref:protein phosphatase CheZ n=1 Tax=Breoghania sp. TaxID=2065378 RepID=UPI002AA6DD26|nr:protein phosphatase CheZ [Breoghania sp.]
MEAALITKKAEGQTAVDPMAGARHRELLDELAALRQLVQPTQQVSETVLEEYKKEHAAALSLKSELDEIYEAINRTKHEIATLHHSGFEGEEMKRVTNELDAIVVGTEGATDQILAAAEVIDENAGFLTRSLTGDDEVHAQEIQERVLTIFEACNFQDLTGQRITKVVKTLSFIEDRIVRMMDIWGGVESFKDMEVEERLRREGDAALLNGPALETDDGVASQDDIDALFA